MGRMMGGEGQRRLSYLAGELVYAAPGAMRISRVEVQTRREWEDIVQQILLGNRLGWTGGRVRQGAMVVLFVGPSGGGTIPTVVDVESSKGLEGVIRARQPGLGWRMGALEFGRMLECRESTGMVDSWQARRAGGCQVYLPAPFASRFSGRRFGLRDGILANPLAVKPETQELVVALRAQYLNLQELLQLTTLRQRAVLRLLAGLRAGGLLIEAPQREWESESPYRRLGLHWTSHEFEIRTRYRELRADVGEEVRDRLEEAFDLLYRPDWRRAYRDQAYPPPMIREVTRHLRRQLSSLRGGEAAHFDRIVDLSRRILELDPDDGDVRRLLTTLLTRAHRSSSTPLQRRR